jgi:hypothetical protein
MSNVIIALSALALTIFVHAAALLIWGAALAQRVRQLEDEAKSLKALPEKVARIEERTGFLGTQFHASARMNGNA